MNEEQTNSELRLTKTSAFLFRMFLILTATDSSQTIISLVPLPRQHRYPPETEQHICRI